MKADSVTGLAIVKRGIEEISALEVKELIKAKAKILDCAVTFECSRKELCRLCYEGRSFTRVVELLDDFEFDDVEDIKNKLQKSKITEFKAKSFAVRCIKENSELQSMEVEKAVGEFFFDKFKVKVDLENPEKTVLCFICSKKFYAGIDYSGIDLNKRDYKIFVHPASLKADIAYFMLRIADYEPKETFLDPFCGSGTIAIEAALFATGKSVHFYSKNKFAFSKFMKYDFKDAEKNAKTKIFACDLLQHHVKSAEKNAKIAGVNKEISFSRTEAEWLDTKFKEKSIDKIVSNPPQVTAQNKNDMEKTFYDFFHNAEYILKPKGKVVLVTNDADFVKKIAERERFKVEKEINIESLKVIVFVL